MMSLTADGLLILINICMFCIRMNVMATFFTNCVHPSSMVYIEEPVFTIECTNLLHGAATCIGNPNCDLFSRNGNLCSFFKHGIDSCNRETSGNITSATFTQSK